MNSLGTAKETLGEVPSRSPSTHRAAEAAPGSWLCQKLVAKLKNVVEDIFILQILPTCQEMLVVMSCREIWGSSEGR